MESLQDLAYKLDHEVMLSSLPPTPSKSATAFTIEFDDLNNNLLKNSQKKIFERGNSLRDSLRKYAPEKLEKLTKLRSKEEDSDSKNVDATKCNSNYSTTATDSDRNLGDGASFLIQRMFSGSSNTTKSSSNKKSANKSNILANKTNQLDIRLSSSCKSSPLKLRNFNSTNKNDTRTISTKINGSLYRSPAVEMDSGVCADEDESVFLKRENVIDDEDALSDAGTYTVELDTNQDPIAEEARKRIDEIFGIGKETRTKQHLDSMSNSSSTNSSKPTSKHSFKVSSIKKGYLETRSRQNSQQRSSKTELQRKNSNSSTERLSFRSRRSSLQQQSTNSGGLIKRQDSFNKSSVSKVSSIGRQINSSSKPLTSTNKKSQLNQNISLINQNNTIVFNCGNNDSSNSLLNRARANSITRNFTKKVTRKDQLKDDDTGSIRSEGASTAGSTDLSSINSEKCKSDTGQTTSSLRFNRAFALRRARLGIDTPPLTNNSSKNKNSTTKPSSNSSSNKPNSHIPITSTNHHQSRAIDFGFDRSDGGRYSLRASSSSSRPPINGQQRLAIANRSKQLQQTNSSNSLNKHETSSLISAISESKNKVANKMIKKNSFIIDDPEFLRSNHVRANSFAGAGDGLPLSNHLKPPRLSSAASTSSNNTMSNASTSEDLSNLSDQINVKGLKHLSPFQLGRRIYSTKPHYMAQTNSFRNKLSENGNNLYTNGNNELTLCDLAQSLTNELPPSLHSLNSEPIKKFGQLSASSTPQPNSSNSFSFNNSNSKSLSALDYLVLSAVHQLSFKLRCKLRSILDAEKSKYPIDNENRILIEELLPQVNVIEYRNSETSEKTISRDLSNVLKNLKRIEQSLEVINLLLESNSFMKSVDSPNDDLLCNKDTLLTNDNFSLEI